MVTRIAPSPTGSFHVGTARTAYFNYLKARATGGKFILRIDDTDVHRNTPENVDTIFRSLEWLGLDYDEVHYQSKRADVYREYIIKMSEAGHCVKGAEGETRLNVPYQQVYEFTDTLRGTVRVSEQEYLMHKELVIARLDGSALYHFASIIDDIDMGVTDIIRGADHLPNTHKQEAIRSLASPETEFNYTHVGLITVGGKKISKRNPEHVHIASLQSYIDQGFSPEAFKNWILRIGWAPKQDTKENSIITQDRALELFVEHGSMKPNHANMDLAHLHSYHKKYGKVLVAQ